MTRFYKNMESLDKREALRKAQLELLRSDCQHPFYWGAVVAAGDWR